MHVGVLFSSAISDGHVPCWWGGAIYCYGMRLGRGRVFSRDLEEEAFLTFAPTFVMLLATLGLRFGGFGHRL